MKNANYKLVEHPVHGGSVWYHVYKRELFFFGMLKFWHYKHTQEKLSYAEKWIEDDKARDIRKKNLKTLYIV